MSAPTSGPWPGGVPSAEYASAAAARELFRRLADREREAHDVTLAALVRQERECARLESVAWYDWHEANGWPEGDEDYRQSLATAAGRRLRRGVGAIDPAGIGGEP